MTDLTALEAAANAATPGPWELGDVGRAIFSHLSREPVAIQPGDLTNIHLAFKRDAHFIAAANPQTVISLIAEIKLLREALKPFADLHDEIKGLMKINPELPQDVEDWMKACTGPDLRRAKQALENEDAKFGEAVRSTCDTR